MSKACDLDFDTTSVTSEQRLSLFQNSITSDFKFTQEQVDELAEIFISLAGSQGGCGEPRLENKYMMVFLQGLDLDPTEVEVEEILEDIDEDNAGSIGLHQFGKFLDKLMKRKNNKVEIIRGYRLLDKDSKGFISIEDLRKAAEAAGEKMDDLELEELIAATGTEKPGVVSKKDFVNFMKVEHFNL